MNNRDFYNKPIQGGSRDGFGYGNTDIDQPETWLERNGLLLFLLVSFMLFGAIVGLAMMLAGVAA